MLTATGPARSASKTAFATLGCLVLALNSPVTAATFGKDQRRPLTAADRSAAQSIGWLKTPKSGAFCSAFCVAPDVIATASHCLFGTKDAPRGDLEETIFTLAENGLAGTAIAGRQTGNVSQNILAGTKALRTTPPIDAHDDWALARLDAPICSGRVLPLSRPRQSAAEPLANIAYHRDIAGTRLSASGDCWPRTGTDIGNAARDFLAAPRLLFHDCDTGGGSSGSPIFRETATGPEVIAINVGTYVVAKAVVSAGDQQEEQSLPVANTAVIAYGLTQKIAALEARELIETEPQMLALAHELRSRGLYPGPITGRANAALSEAVKTYERLSGLPETGLFLVSTLRRLETER